MAEKLGLDNDVHELKLGSSFGGGPVAYHSFRYDFKPASVDTTQEASVDIGEGNSVTVTVPHVEGSGTSHTVYKGNKKPCQKECVLIIDHQTGEITLEKLSSNIQLKKTSQFTCKQISKGVRSILSLDNGLNNPTDPNVNEKPSGTNSNRFTATSLRPGEHGENVSSTSKGHFDERHSACHRKAHSSSKPVKPMKNRSVIDVHRRDLVEFSKSIECDISKFLKSHPMEKERRPYLSSSLSMDSFRINHPNLYKKAKERASLNEYEVDSLNSYLCGTFPQFLVDRTNIYGCVQRLEDVINYVISRFTEISKDHKHD